MVRRFQASDGTIRQDYFDWLCGMVSCDGRYLLLLKTLHERDFVAIMKRDENRALDGMELREEYFETNPYFGSEALDGPCSCLEMLIALSRRMVFDTQKADIYENSTRYWFWKMVDNLGMTCYDDDHFTELDGVYNISEELDTFLSRTYGSDGFGGLFPLKRPAVDQREIEIWYQKEAYLKEMLG